jgi:hypothetical protein
MKRELSLEEVAKNVEVWRKSKKHRGEILPQEIADDIKKLAKFHKRYHITKALKMSSDTINKALNENFNSCKKVKRNYNVEERLTLCQEWQHSGISIEKFCRTHNISRSSFYQWCRQLDIEAKDKQPNWVPLQATQPAKVLDMVTIEFALPNQMVANIKLSKSYAVDFFQELYHATTVIR